MVLKSEREHADGAPVPQGNHITVLQGSLAPESALIKLGGKTLKHFEGPAQCYDGEQAAFEAIIRGEIRKGSALIIRYEGPRGSPGMPEMLSPGAASRRRDCHFDGTPLCFPIETPTKGTGGCHQMTVSPTARPPW